MMIVRQIVLVGIVVLNITCSSVTFAKSQNEKIGDVLQFAIPLTGLGLAVTKSDGEGEKQLGETLLVSTVATYGLKYAFNNTSLGKRPNGGDYSFPSGHTSISCAGAGFIGQRYGWEYGAIAMLPAGYAGWTRVEADKHHVRDVIAGCAVGTISSLLMTQPFDNTTINPWYEDKTLGLSIISRW